MSAIWQERTTPRVIGRRLGRPDRETAAISSGDVPEHNMQVEKSEFAEEEEEEMKKQNLAEMGHKMSGKHCKMFPHSFGQFSPFLAAAELKTY